jgi:hypothetical protein
MNNLALSQLENIRILHALHDLLFKQGIIYTKLSKYTHSTVQYVLYVPYISIKIICKQGVPQNTAKTQKQLF